LARTLRHIGGAVKGRAWARDFLKTRDAEKAVDQCWRSDGIALF